jgi:N-acetyl-anhydromuramyl-L-alanine amidase AmpD
MKPFIIKEGIVQNALILQRRFNNLEHGELKPVAGIVLHQTSRDSADETLLLYRRSANGAHFLISQEGIIYQTARVNRVCYHVGFLAPRCKAENTCSPNYLAAIDRIFASDMAKEDKLMLQHQLEKAKKPQARYPDNTETIGIEVSGAPIGRVYQRATAAQDIASTWLVAQLMQAFNLTRNDVYRHGVIGAGKIDTEAMHVRY